MTHLGMWSFYGDGQLMEAIKLDFKINILAKQDFLAQSSTWGVIR